MIMEYNCPHIDILDNNPEVRLQNTLGFVSTTGEAYCKKRVPQTHKHIFGQDVSCVGPYNPSCPDPESVKFVLK